MGIPTGFLWVCLWVWVSVAKVRFGLVFILSGETRNWTASSVQHIAQTGTGTARNGSDRFGLHLNQVQTWNCWPSGFWPCESSTHIYWCCVDQIRAVTPRFACRSNRLDLQGFSCSKFARRSNGLNLRSFSCSGFARRSNRLNLQGFWNPISRCETVCGSSGLNHVQTWFCNSTVARTANRTCGSVPWSYWTWTELLVQFGVWTGFALVLNRTSATLCHAWHQAAVPIQVITTIFSNHAEFTLKPLLLPLLPFVIT